jgi:hypothetical protein
MSQGSVHLTPTCNREASMKSIIISTAILLFIGLGGSVLYHALLGPAGFHNAAAGAANLCQSPIGWLAHIMQPV